MQMPVLALCILHLPSGHAAFHHRQLGGDSFGDVGFHRLDDGFPRIACGEVPAALDHLGGLLGDSPRARRFLAEAAAGTAPDVTASRR